MPAAAKIAWNPGVLLVAVAVVVLAGSVA